ncbi:hypothetical protein PCANC_01597 [Puccinia coronata f. sp. avenae]|uniref:Uncharacterized protein n=1 Tax=Puccinia coronata f. sp. avenae TaxID=200324 RepID=A0A2N5W0I2_9BASI|nr:hypothetical protein PCANC_01597 [Puccinia coronata f. sp. avenae]
MLCLQKQETPKINLDEEFKMLMVTLLHKNPDKIGDVLNQMKKIATGTHFAIAIKAPNVKTKTKGRPSLKKDRLTSTTRNSSAFEVVEARLKKNHQNNKCALNVADSKESKQIKRSPSNKDEGYVDKEIDSVGNRSKDNGQPG